MGDVLPDLAVWRNMDWKRAMEEAIHSGEMEGSYVSAEFRRDAEQYVEGNFSIEELMTRTKRRWGVVTSHGAGAQHV